MDMETDYYPDCDDQIDPEQAKHLFENCAILIIEQLPVGSEFGIDLVSYEVCEKFKGVKLIPPGIHFIYAAAISSEIDHNNSNDIINFQESTSSSLMNERLRRKSTIGPRCGFYHNFKTKELLIKKWSTKEEEFDLNYCVSEEQYDRYYCNLKNLDPFLGAYSYSKYQRYLNLIDKVKPEIVENLLPTIRLIRSVPYLINSENQDSNSKKIKRITTKQVCDNEKLTEEDLLPNLKPDKNTVIKFTKIPDNHLDSKETISPNMITQYNLDTTFKLESNFREDDKFKEINGQQLLAEFQFSFLTFLLCHVYYCFEHWKLLLKLICLAEKGITKYPILFIDFIQILKFQVEQIPEDMFDDIVDSNNLIRTILDTFFQNINDCDNINNNNEINLLKENALEFKKYLEKKFNWEFDLENEDEQPIIVNL